MDRCDKKIKRFWDKKLAFELYGEGKSDREIAEACGICRETVASWRKRCGLPANECQPIKKKGLTQLEQDAIAARKAGLTYGQYKAQQYAKRGW